ncbi:MAG: peptide chain release factor aRF-1 [archaeon]|mgnify:CR=1 FL=1
MAHLDLNAMDAEKALFKKKIKMLESFKGSGTELISVYIPPGTDRSIVMKQLSDEVSQSSNIKDPKTRKNVQGALRKIINLLKQINFKLPDTGLAIFCGNVSPNDGKVDIKLFTVKPVNKLETKLYWCDSEFHLIPLKNMVQPTDIYVIVTMDKREATFAVLKGKRYDIVGNFKSRVAGKIRAGGQCLHPETLIQLSDGEIIEIQEAHNPLEICAANLNNLELSNTKITNKWENNKNKLIQITTKYPKLDLTCSEEHTLFKVAEEGIAEITASSLREGDLLIMPARIEISGKTQLLNTHYYNNYKINTKGLGHLAKQRNSLRISQKQLGEMLGAHQASVSALELGKFDPSDDYLENYCTVLKIPLDPFLKKYCKKKTDIKLPTYLNKKLAQFLGYLIGDGNIEKERIAFSEQNREIALIYEKLGKTLFHANTNIVFRNSKNYWQVRIYGKPIADYILNEFPEVKKALDSNIPAKVLKSKNKVLASFIKGLFDAEGYVTKRGLSISMNNKKIIEHLRMALLRFGIIASVYEYDNRKNIYSKNNRYTLDITEKESLKTFKKTICFSSKIKFAKLKKCIKNKTMKSNVRQIIVPGSEIREIFENVGYNTCDFPKVSNFFRNERLMGKTVFKKSIINKVKANKGLRKKFENILNIPILPVKIAKLQKIRKETKTIDITTKMGNFMANGLIVHNSAQRFERLREEAEHDFYRKVSEEMNKAFVGQIDKIRGIIVGGPGLTKNYFLETDLLDHRLKNKIIGKIDVGYTDPSGIKEAIDKSHDVLQQTDIIREKQIVQEFMMNVVKTGLATYGEKEVEAALTARKVSKLLISEGLEKMIYKVKCTACDYSEVMYQEPDLRNYKCKLCGSALEIIEEVDYADYLMEKAAESNAETHMVSTETDEGKQFQTGFGGIGAILRYK